MIHVYMMIFFLTQNWNLQFIKAIDYETVVSEKEFAIFEPFTEIMCSIRFKR